MNHPCVIDFYPFFFLYLQVNTTSMLYLLFQLYFRSIEIFSENMMFANDLHLSSVFILFFYLVFTEATKLAINNTMINSTSNINMTFNENVTTIVTTEKTLFIQGQEFVHKHFNKMNRNTLIWSTVTLATITCVISIYIAIKTFL